MGYCGLAGGSDSCVSVRASNFEKYASRIHRSIGDDIAIICPVGGLGRDEKQRFAQALSNNGNLNIANPRARPHTAWPDTNSFYIWLTAEHHQGGNPLNLHVNSCRRRRPLLHSRARRSLLSR